MQVYWSVFVDTCKYHAWLIRYDTAWFFGPFEVNFKWNDWNIAAAALLILFLFRKERRKWTVLMTRKEINISTYSKVLRRIESLEKKLTSAWKMTILGRSGFLGNTSRCRIHREEPKHCWIADRNVSMSHGPNPTSISITYWSPADVSSEDYAGVPSSSCCFLMSQTMPYCVCF